MQRSTDACFLQNWPETSSTQSHSSLNEAMWTHWRNFTHSMAMKMLFSSSVTKLVDYDCRQNAQSDVPVVAIANA